MKKRLPIFILFFTIIVSPWKTFSQDTTTFYDNIKNYDLTTIWSGDSIETNNLDFPVNKIKRPEPLGYIDTNYTRFYIHFISVKKNKDNPYLYNITGKTRVGNNICDFTGTIKIIESKVEQKTVYRQYKQGYAICEVIFYEDEKQPSSGVITGKLRTQFIVDKTKIKYNGLMLIADSFSNNEFAGIWTSYKTNKSKKCNWGDFRIPDSGDLDMGAGEFSPSDKYLKNGWQSYRDSFGKQYKPKDNWWTK
jgi:hypothetical protein